MTFDQQVLLWCIAVPATFVAGTCIIGILLDRYTTKRGTLRLGSLLAAVGWVFSVHFSIVARQGWVFTPQDQWQYFILPLALWSLLGYSKIADSDQSWRWMLVGLLAGCSAFSCLPRGEGWEDAYPEHGAVGIALVLGMLVNSWALSKMRSSGAGQWLTLVALASLGGPLALAASSYASLAECNVAMISSTLVLVVCGVVGKELGVSRLAPIVATAALCILAVGKFQTFEDHPTWLYLLNLLLPSLIFATDLPLRKQSTWIRIVVAGLIATASVSTSAWYFLFQGTDSW